MNGNIGHLTYTRDRSGILLQEYPLILESLSVNSILFPFPISPLLQALR